MKNEITPQRLRERLHYDPLTGLFQKRLANGSLGRVSEPDKKSGYRTVCVDYQVIRAARAAWAYVNGVWPEKPVDHINGNRSDDRIANLRLVTDAENSQNRQGANRNRVLALPLGVYPRGEKYESRICISGIKHRFFPFDTPEEAQKAYLDFRRKNAPGNTL